MALAEVELILAKTGVLNFHFIALAVNAFSLGVKNVAPLTLWEEICVCLIGPISVGRGLDGQLKRRSKHNVLRRVGTIRSSIVGELEENWLVEGTVCGIVLRK